MRLIMWLVLFDLTAYIEIENAKNEKEFLKRSWFAVKKQSSLQRRVHCKKKSSLQRNRTSSLPGNVYCKEKGFTEKDISVEAMELLILPIPTSQDFCRLLSWLLMFLGPILQTIWTQIRLLP